MTATNPSINTASIAERAMLVNISFTLFGSPFKTDKKISKEVTDSKGMQAERGKFQKEIIAKRALDSLNKFAASARTEHYRRTLPWADDGARILSTAGYFEYAEFMRKTEAEWPSVVSAFLNAYESHIDESRAALGLAFDESDYPTVSQLRRKLSFRWSVRPVPATADFRWNLSADEVNSINDRITAQWQETIRAGMNEVWTRLREVVGKMAERLRAYDPNNASAAPFRDSLVSNITELLEVVPSLNLTGDSAVEDFARRIRQDLTRFDAQALRDNMFTREDVAQRAESIYNQMAAFIS